MPYSGAADVSSSAWLGYQQETTPGTLPGGSWTMIPTEQGGTTWPQLQPDRQPVRIMNSSPNNIIGYVDKQGRTNVAILQPIIPTFIGNWLHACGLKTDASAGFETPQPTISLLDVYGGIAARTFSGLRCSKLTFSGSSQQGEITLLSEFMGTVPEATASAPAVPSPVFEDPYIWGNWQAPGLIGTTSGMECDDWELVVDFGIGGGLGEFWGGGQTMPTRNQKTRHDVTGKLSILHATAEETAFINRTTGIMNLALNYPTGSHTLLFSLPKVKYVTYVVDQSEGKFITAQLTYGALSTDLSDVLIVTVT